MPFTLSHPAAVVPLNRAFPRYTVLSALVVGSIIPDIASVVPSTPIVTNPYAPSIVFGVGLPMGLLVLWFFHEVIKRPLVQLFPYTVRERLRQYRGPFRFLPASRFVCVLLSLLLGMCTHVIWDSMTHGHGWMVERIALLREQLFTVGSYPMIAYFLFKHFSTVLGLAVLAFWSSQWLYGATDAKTGARLLRYSWRVGSLALILIIASIGGVGLAIFTTEFNYAVVSRLVRYAVIGCGTVVVVYCVAYDALFPGGGARVSD